MANTCSICKHENRLDIDWLIVNQTPYRDISLRFNVGVMSVQRHKKHIEVELREVQQVQKIERGTKLLDRLYVNQRRIEEALQRARNSADLRSEALLLKLEQSNMDLEAKMTGAYKQPAVNPQDRTAELNLLIEEIQDRALQAGRPMPSRLADVMLLTAQQSQDSKVYRGRDSALRGRKGLLFRSFSSRTAL